MSILPSVLTLKLLDPPLLISSSPVAEDIFPPALMSPPALMLPSTPRPPSAIITAPVSLSEELVLL